MMKKIRYSFWIFILVFLGGSTSWAGVSVSNNKAPVAESVNCFATDPKCPTEAAQWLEMRKTEAISLGGYCPNGFYKKCSPSLPPEVKECYGSLLDYKNLMEKEKTLDLSPSKLSRSYFDKEPVKSLTDPKTIPPALTDPKFLAMINNPSTMGEAIATLRKNYPQYKIARYSGNAGALDGSGREEDRLLVVVPGEKEDRWLQFTVPTMEEEKTANTMPKPYIDVDAPAFLNSDNYNQFSLVVVDKSNVRTPSDRPQVFFRDYRRTPTGHGLTVNNREVSSESCLKCHPGGVNPVYPNLEKTSPEDKKIVEQLNGMAVEYGIPSNATAKFAAVSTNTTTDPKMNVNVSAYGPALGPVDPASRTDEFMAGCAPRLSAERRAELKNMMNCSACHDGNSLTPKLDKSIPNLKAAFKFGAYELPPIYDVPNSDLKRIIVEHNAMPLGATATRDEREALFKCLIDEKNIIENKFTGEYSCPAMTAQNAFGSKNAVGEQATAPAITKTDSTKVSIDQTAGVNGSGSGAVQAK